MGDVPLHLHRAERTDLLAERLGALLAVPPADPFATDVVMVPARGVERWLSQRLSHLLGAIGGDGVCAGVQFRSPASLIAELTVHTGIDGPERADPWSPEALTWPLLAVIDAHCDQPWCRILAAHLGHFDDGAEALLRRGRRYAVARRLAGLFASYARQRPHLLVDWLDGADTDGAGGPSTRTWPGSRRCGGPWSLWSPWTGSSPASAPPADARAAARRGAARGARPAVAVRAHPAGGDRCGTADRVGHPPRAAPVAAAPSDALWRQMQDMATGPAVARRDDPSATVAAHPLLTTLGRDARELRRALPTAATDDYLGPAPAADTLLGWLQSDIAANAVRPAGRHHRAGDRSVQVHSCHGAARQVDVLREVLLGLLHDDPSLQPRDIVVMCPDIETYAPLIAAGFGLGELAGENHPAHLLRVQLADRALHQTNPLLAVAAELLDLADGRATASAVLNLAQAPPVRGRFAFTDDDIEVITGWVQQTNIRWGFDAEHRRRYGLGDFVHNTWRFGLDRILTGVAMSQDSQAWLGTALPLDDVGSNRVELAGRLTEFVDRVQRALDSLTGAQPLPAWLAALTDAVAALTRVDTDDGWQQGQLDREFAQVLTDAGDRAGTDLLLPDVRSLLGNCLAGRPTRANFRTGSLTVCTMVPMRSVPHRVVCLVGVDDGVFPGWICPTATTCWPVRRAPVSATSVPRTANCCSTRSARPPRRW